MPLIIQVGSIQEAAREVVGLIDQAVDPDRVADAASAVLLNRIRTRYRQQTDADGNRWPVSEAARKRAAGIPTGRSRKPGGFVGGFTLFESGALFQSIQIFDDAEGVRSIGTDVEYGVFHQFGTRFLPRRQFLGFNQEDADVAELTAVSVIQAALR